MQKKEVWFEGLWFLHHGYPGFISYTHLPSLQFLSLNGDTAIISCRVVSPKILIRSMPISSLQRDSGL